MKPLVLYLKTKYINLLCMVRATNTMVGTSIKGSKHSYKLCLYKHDYMHVDTSLVHEKNDANKILA